MYVCGRGRKKREIPKQRARTSSDTQVQKHGQKKGALCESGRRESSVLGEGAEEARRGDKEVGGQDG